MNLPEQIVKAFDILETNFHPKWNSGLGTKEKLILAFSQTELAPHTYLGYKKYDGLSHALVRAIPEITKHKKAGQAWQDYLLQLTDSFLCRDCKEVLSLLKKVPKENQCNLCSNKETIKKRQNKRQLVYNYLICHPCIDCGETDPVVLEFDHLLPEDKKHNISNMMSYSWNNIHKEIQKCEVVCANCHRRRTAKQYNWYSWLE